MSANYEFNLPVLVVNNGVATSGHTKDLASGQVSIFDRQTWNVATPSGNGSEFFLGIGSYHTKDSLSKFWAGMQRSLKTYFFRGQDIQSFEVSYSQKLQNEEWVIGYDGTSAANNFLFQCGKDYQLRITLKGEPIYRVFGKTLEHIVGLTTASCLDPNCTTGCSDNLDVVKYIKQFADNINNHPELKLLGVKAKAVLSNYTVTVAQATVVVNLVATTVAAVNVISGGSGYTSAPTAVIAGGGGTGASATVTVANGVVTGVTGLVAGSGFTSTPTVTLSGGGGTGAVLKAFLTPVAVNTTPGTIVGGSGYLTAPTVTFTTTGSAGSGAAATTTLTNGSVTGVTISSGGSGYNGTVTATISAPVGLLNKYQISVCDTGDGVALMQIQQTVGGINAIGVAQVARVSRLGAISTYEICSATAPSAFTPTLSVPLEICTTCPTGYTETVAKDVYIIQRPVLPSTDLSSPAAKLTYAQSIATAYSLSTADASFVSLMNGDLAQVKVKQAAGTAALVPLFSDTITKEATEPGICTPTAASSIAWVSTGTAYAGFRTLTLTADRPDCNAAGDRLADITAFIATFPSYVSGTIVKTAGTACADVYTITQLANTCGSDSCLSYDAMTFDTPPAFEGRQWTPVAPSIVAYDSNIKAGLRISAGYIDTKFGDCSFEPTDYYNTAPIQLELAWVVDFPNAPDVSTFVTARRTQKPYHSRQTGEWLVRELIASDAYNAYGYDNNNPRIREVMDVQARNQVDRNAYYKLYYLNYKTNRENMNFGQQKEVFETIIAFKEDDPRAKAFETLMEGITSKFGVYLQKR